MDINADLTFFQKFSLYYSSQASIFELLFQIIKI